MFAPSAPPSATPAEIKSGPVGAILGVPTPPAQAQPHIEPIARAQPVTRIAPKDVAMIDAALDERANRQEFMRFVERLKNQDLLDINHQPITVLDIIEYLFVNNIKMIAESFYYALLNISSRDKDLITELCQRYVAQSGLANFFLARMGLDVQSSVLLEDKISVREELLYLKKGADLGCVNAQYLLAYAALRKGYKITEMCKELVIVDQEYILKLLHAAALSGHENAALLLFKEYSEKHEYLHLKTDLGRAKQYLEMVIPSRTGQPEYELGVMFLDGRVEEDGQTIAADPTRALELFQRSAAKDNSSALALISLYQRCAHMQNSVPIVVRRALMRIHDQKPQASDASLIAGYLTTVRYCKDLAPIYALFIVNKIKCLPPVVFQQLRTMTLNTYQDRSIFLHNFKMLSPLIETLFETYDGPYFPARRGCPHAEFGVYTRAAKDLSGLKRSLNLGMVAEQQSSIQQYLRRAAEHGHPEAQHQLALQYFTKGDNAAGEMWLQRACLQYHAPSLIERENRMQFAPVVEFLVQLRGEDSDSAVVAYLCKMMHSVASQKTTESKLPERILLFLCEHSEIKVPARLFVQLLQWLEGDSDRSEVRTALKELAEKMTASTQLQPPSATELRPLSSVTVEPTAEIYEKQPQLTLQLQQEREQEQRLLKSPLLLCCLAYFEPVPALTLLMRAVANNNPFAAYVRFRLGVQLHLFEPQETIDVLERACAMNFGPALRALGNLHWNGFERSHVKVPVDWRRALEFYERAVQQNFMSEDECAEKRKLAEVPRAPTSLFAQIGNGISLWLRPQADREASMPLASMSQQKSYGATRNY